MLDCTPCETAISSALPGTHSKPLGTRFTSLLDSYLCPPATIDRVRSWVTRGDWGTPLQQGARSCRPTGHWGIHASPRSPAVVVESPKWQPTQIQVCYWHVRSAIKKHLTQTSNTVYPGPYIGVALIVSDSSHPNIPSLLSYGTAELWSVSVSILSLSYNALDAAAECDFIDPTLVPIETREGPRGGGYELAFYFDSMNCGL